jgi:hypothetical protein
VPARAAPATRRPTLPRAARQALPVAAQCLFLRLHPRRGPWFRLGALAYSEVPDAAAAARALADAGLAALLERAGPAGARRGCTAGRAGPLSMPQGVFACDTCTCMHVWHQLLWLPRRQAKPTTANFCLFYRDKALSQGADSSRAGRGARADAEAVVNVLTAPELAALAARLKLHPPGRASGNSRAQLLARVAGALRAGEVPAASGMRVRRGRRPSGGRVAQDAARCHVHRACLSACRANQGQHVALTTERSAGP